MNCSILNSKHNADVNNTNNEMSDKVVHKKSEDDYLSNQVNSNFNSQGILPFVFVKN